MIIILYNLLVKITIVPIFFFFSHESTVPAAWLTLQTQKGTRVICHLQQKGPFLKVDMSFPSVYLFIIIIIIIIFGVCILSQKWVYAKDLCRSAWLRWIYSNLRNQKKTLKQSRVNFNGSLENPSLHIGLPIWRQK